MFDDLVPYHETGQAKDENPSTFTLFHGYIGSLSLEQ
jgi:hypothetical protein